MRTTSIHRALTITLGTCALFASGPVSAAAPANAVSEQTDPVTCSVNVTRPQFSTLQSENRAPRYRAMKIQSGASYIYVSGSMRRNFNLSADLQNPKVPSNHGVFYTDNVTLLTYPPSNASISIEIIRTERKRYRPEVALAWVEPGKGMVYRDTDMMLSDGWHNLQLGADGSTIHLGVDGKIICKAPYSAFFTAQERKYYQVETEVSAPGDIASGLVRNIMFKGDRGGASVFPVRCVYRGFGVSWDPVANGMFRANGTFEPHVWLGGFSGATRTRRCSTH